MKENNNPGEERLTGVHAKGNERKLLPVISGIGSLVLLAASGLFILLGYVILPVAGIVLSAIASVTAIWLIRKSASKKGRELDQVTDLNLNQGEFLAGFSHRIREPLNNLVIIGDLISDTTLTPKQKDLVETLIASTTNMVSTVNELTMQSAGTASFGRRKPIRFSVVAAIQNTIELFNLSSPVPVGFTIETSGSADSDVFGDPIVVKQIILDLLNRLSGQPAGTPLKVEVEKPLKAGNSFDVKIVIISAVRLMQYNDETRQPSLAEKLIDSFGGTFLSSMQGNNYQFAFTVPFRNSETKNVKQEVASRKFAELTREEPKRKKDLKELSLLLVEDNLINQRITFLTLKPLVRNIDTASNGKEALDMVATADYDIILMDIQMPVMDGLIAAEKIRALEKSTGKHVPIIAITANAMLGDKEKCLSAGMDDYISKPFQPSSLIEKIKQFS
ncbi:MAG: response regulator [Bacteroidetes bacterium]|nr:response regulator [Bacteroidota bacterium]